jgi:hypothetical protein
MRERAHQGEGFADGTLRRFAQYALRNPMEGEMGQMLK